MNILSLFDGMSCGQLALKKLGVPVGDYYASEIDKPAIAVAKHNFPNTKHLGDVTQWKNWEIDWGSIDLILAGSPCQGFSFAGKQLAFDDPRSKLFFTFADILQNVQEFNPDVKFLLENVRMKKEHLDVINDVLNVEPVFINSSLVSAQNRPRFYWSNWEFKVLLKCKPEKTFDQVFSGDLSHKVTLTESARIRNSKRNRIIKLGETVKCGAILAAQNTKYGTDCLVIDSGEEQLSRLDITTMERLQTLPDGYTQAGKSRAQRGKMIGNGWTIDVIAHILKPMVERHLLGDLF